MQHFLKEKKKIVKTITKCGSPQVVAPEVHFYQTCASKKYQTPELTAHTSESLTIEYIDGISCFNYLKHLKDNDIKASYLDFLIEEVLKFQKISRRLTHDFRPYAVKEKLDETIQIMRLVGHPALAAAEQTHDLVLEHFYKYATIPFRDATPKNSIIKLEDEDINKLDLNDIKKRTYHYDFSTVNELTTIEDDIISTLYHHFIDDDLRNEILRKYKINTQSSSFVITAYLRIGRFWSRRYFYKHFHPELFKVRYSGEDISYYDRAFNESIENVTITL